MADRITTAQKRLRCFFWAITSTTARISSENATSRSCNHFSIIQSHYICQNALTILELTWNKRFRDNKTKLNVICHHLLTSSTQQLQNRSFHTAERTRASAKRQNVKNARAKRAKLLFFHCQICKFVTFFVAVLVVAAQEPGARFSKVPKLFGRISGYIFLFVSSKRKASRGMKLCSSFTSYSLYNL